MEVIILPFLNKPKFQTGVIVKDRQPDEKPEQSDDSADAIHACAQDLIEAVHSKNVKNAAEAIKSAFEILESMPHEENDEDHVEPHSYAAQNQKAAQE